MTRCEPTVRHHLEGARVDEIADQHARLVAEDVVSRGAAAAFLRAVDHVVVQQRGGVHELDEGCGFDVFFVFDAAGAAREHAEQGAQSFAATANDVFGNLVDQGHRALEAGADHGVDARRDRCEPGRGSPRAAWPGSAARGPDAQVGSDVTLELI